jgi:putative membrane protein insertion efficiency factor
MSSAESRRPGIVALVLLALVALYRVSLGYLLGGRCRFYPSCSRYAQLALLRFGAVRGGALIVRRIARCHPWHPGGVDLVPQALSGCREECHE